MQLLDWLVLGGTLLFIVIYGAWKTRGSKNMQGYLLGNRDMKWYTVGLSIMATQASAITFLSTPGQAFDDGMRFVQFYFGLPLAMVILCITVVPIYHRLNVYTAYEYLEKRFDLRTRALAAFLFLLQRGLAAGFTIFAPSLILSVILGWNIYWTNLVIGLLVIIYTVAGGTKAVSQTQKHQMIVIFTGMIAAAIMIFQLMPEDVSFTDALHVAGKMDKLNATVISFDWQDKYNIWSGLIGGLFLALSYFGTDQSQVQRYLSGKSITQSRLGLLMNGLVKVPMQFLILFIGAMVFVFYIFVQPPLFFNPVEERKVEWSEYSEEYGDVKEKFSSTFELRKEKARDLIRAVHSGNEIEIDAATIELKQANNELQNVRQHGIELMQRADPLTDTNDTNYVFLTFVTDFLPAGLVGLLIAVILSASMSSTSSELNALASTTVVDVYKRLLNKNATDGHYVKTSKLITVFWGFYAIAFAMFANRLGTLIEAVNILGSLVYGVILGIFLSAFYLKKVTGQATFIAALIAEVIVIYTYFGLGVPYLWLNVIGCLVVMGLALVLSAMKQKFNL